MLGKVLIQRDAALHNHTMPIPSAKRVALNKLTLTKRAVDAMKPSDKPWTAWDDKLTGFGVPTYPSRLHSLRSFRASRIVRRTPRVADAGFAAHRAPLRARRLLRIAARSSAAAAPTRRVLRRRFPNRSPPTLVPFWTPFDD